MKPDPPVLYCECGCGEPAPTAKANHRIKGHIKGQPVRFVNGHNARGVPKSPETLAKMRAAQSQPRPWLRGPRPGAIRNTTPTLVDAHDFLARHFPKRGICAECSRSGKTDYAFLRHGEPYTRNRRDYRELCRSCHMRFDYANGTRK